MFTRDKGRYVIHRTRAVQRIHGYQVFEFARLQTAKRILHAGRFKLESRSSVALAVKVEGGLVIERDILDIKVYSMSMLDVVDGFL